MRGNFFGGGFSCFCRGFCKKDGVRAWFFRGGFVVIEGTIVVLRDHVADFLKFSSFPEFIFV